MMLSSRNKLTREGNIGRTPAPQSGSSGFGSHNDFMGVKSLEQLKIRPVQPFQPFQAAQAVQPNNRTTEAARRDHGAPVSCLVRPATL